MNQQPPMRTAPHGSCTWLMPRHFGVPTALYKWVSVVLQIRRKLSDPSPLSQGRDGVTRQFDVDLDD